MSLPVMQGPLYLHVNIQDLVHNNVNFKSCSLFSAYVCLQYS